MLPTTTPMMSQRMSARDITDEFTSAASKLDTGQLIKDEHFTLFEAVGALEIMDSKMDSGYLAPGETLDDDYDVTRELLPEEVLGIMDQLLCHEVAWHMGHPLSQTLFTSIYLDRLLWPVPKTLDEAQFSRQLNEAGTQEPGEQGGGKLVSVVLRAYCLALIKACDFVHMRVSSEYYYEEEDFVTLLYDRKLLSNVPPEEIQEVINDAIACLDDQIPNVGDNIKQALVDRLVFRRSFLSFLNMDTAVIELRSTESLHACLHQIDLLQDSMAVGKPVEESFSLKIQRRLASTVPPRPIIKMRLEDAITHLKRFCHDAIDLQEFLDYRNPHDLQTSIYTLQSRKPEPSVYIRSLVQALLVCDSQILGSIDAEKFCRDDIADLVLPSSQLLDAHNEVVEMPSDPRFQIQKLTSAFFKRMSQPFVDSYRTLCLNRCRVRRTLCHTIVDWDRLQVEAEDCDTQLRTLTMEQPINLQGEEPTYSYPLSSWTYHQKLRQIRLILQLGFELSIYSPEELPGMYWYLSHICSTHLAHLGRIHACVTAAHQRPPPRLSQAKSDERNQTFNRTFALLDRLTTELVAIDAFAIALHALYALLSRYDLIKTNYRPSSKEYSPPKLRYELRIKPFLPISLPETVPYEVFEREAALEGDSDKAVLTRAVRAIAEARKGFESRLAQGPYLEPNKPEPQKTKEKDDSSPGLERDTIKDVKDTLRACIAASIAIGTVKTAVLSASGEPKNLNISVETPEVGSKARWHDCWAVPQVSEKMVIRGGNEATETTAT